MNTPVLTLSKGSLGRIQGWLAAFAVIAFFGGYGRAQQPPDQPLAWAASIASHHAEVTDHLEQNPANRLEVEFAPQWSVWIVTFYHHEDPVLSASVNREGKVVEVALRLDQERDISDDDTGRRQVLQRALETARAEGNQLEEREIVELLEQMEREGNEEKRGVQRRKRDVDFRPTDSALPAYQLQVPEREFSRMTRSVNEEIHVRGELQLAAKTFPVELRLRGASTRHAVKKSYRLRFLEETPLSRQVTYLKAEPMDHTMQQEKLSCDLFEAAGLPVSNCRYINLFVNGSYEGVYLDMEPVRSPFKNKAGLKPEGTLIRAQTFQHANQTGTLGNLRGDVGQLEELEEFIERLNRVGRGEFEAFARSETDWPKVRDYLAMQVICHRSEIEADDYLFYRDPSSRKWSLIPRDHNNGNFAVVPYGNRLAEPSISLFPQSIQDLGWRPNHWFVLPSRIFNNAVLKADYLTRLEDYVNRYLLSEWLVEKVEANYRALLTSYPIDPYRTPWSSDEDPFLRSAEDLRHFARSHGKRLLTLIERERNRQASTVVINEIGREGNQAWVELLNRGSETIQLEGYALASRDENARNRSSALWGTIGIGQIRLFKMSSAQSRAIGSVAQRGGLLVLTSESDESREPPNGVVDFLYLDRMRGSESYGRDQNRFSRLVPTPNQPNQRFPEDSLPD